MKGRQVITLIDTLTLDELEEIFRDHWTETPWTRQVVTLGKEYISLPATNHFRVLAYPKKNGVVLVTYYEENQLGEVMVEGFANAFLGSLFTKYLSNAKKNQKERELERTTIAEEKLLHYTDILRKIFTQGGLTDRK